MDDVVDDYINTGTLRGDVVVQNSTTGLVCFTCTFVEGSQSLGCFIEYLCTRTEYNGQFNIKRSLGSQNVTKCIDGIYMCDYNISIYDIKQPAYQLIQYNIDGLFPSTISASPISSPSQIDTTNSVPTASESLINGSVTMHA